ncbi:MAG: primosomal protein N' [Burkholderiaceae bacterium]
MSFWPTVILATPAHSQVGQALSYRSEQALPVGALVRVPLGKRDTLGVILSCLDTAPTDIDAAAIKPISTHLSQLPPLGHAWLDLVRFAARYYQRGVGEVALAALPPELKKLDPTQLARRLTRNEKGRLAREGAVTAEPLASEAAEPAEATMAQKDALDGIRGADKPILLFGVTGSGKTEVYLQAAAECLAKDDTTQVLVLVPEINLTPQLEARFFERFQAHTVVAIHSGLTPAQRLQSWLSAHMGHARIVLGTRMAIFASLPSLGLIVVDEEHDPSYKSQEGARYSARDLAIYRAHATPHCRVILGSATPSLETWHAAMQGRYARFDMPDRIGDAAMPTLRLVDMQRQPKQTVLAQPLLDAIIARAHLGEQSLLLLNRRGYAPVLSCGACAWKSDCPNCSAFRVFHKIDRSLRCHHCGFAERVPPACPNCGNVDIQTVGRGTEQLEELVANVLAAAPHSDGRALRVGRLDADTSKGKGQLDAHLAAMHSGDIDVLVGTQMVAKGHDFRRITLVAAINPDGALFASDFRAPERMFSLLMQAGGRAGRAAAFGSRPELWVQTWHPTHALFAALRAHDYPTFASQELAERQAANLPPFAAQALLRADAKTQAAAQAFLTSARQRGQAAAEQAGIDIYPAVPLTIARIANVERAQMLVECTNRAALQRFIQQWQADLHALRHTPEGKPIIRWAIDVDPLAI